PWGCNRPIMCPSHYPVNEESSPPASRFPLGAPLPANSLATGRQGWYGRRKVFLGLMWAVDGMNGENRVGGLGVDEARVNLPAAARRGDTADPAVTCLCH